MRRIGRVSRAVLIGGLLVVTGTRLGAGEDRRPDPIEIRLSSIFTLDAGTAWVGGSYERQSSHSEGPALFRTVDAGASWQMIEIDLAPDKFVSSVFFLDHDLGWLAISSGSPGGGAPAVLRTVDGGMSWSLHEIDLPIAPAPSIAYSPVSIEFLTPQHGLLRLSHVIVEDEEAYFVTDDGGESWRFSHARSGQRTSRAQDATLWKLGSFCDSCDSNAVFWSSDDGLTWQQVTPLVTGGDGIGRDSDARSTEPP